MFNLLTSDFKLAKSIFLVKDDSSTPDAFWHQCYAQKVGLVLENIDPFL